MVQAEVQRSASGVARAVESRDVKTILATGTLAAVGASVTMVAASAAEEALGEGGADSRMDMAILGLVAGLTAWAFLRFLGDGFGGGLAIGSVLVVGLSVIGVVLGPDAVPLHEEENINIDGSFDIGDGSGQISGSAAPAGPQASLPDGAIRDVQDQRPNHGFR